jgi:hypothetical protein
MTVSGYRRTLRDTTAPIPPLSDATPAIHENITSRRLRRIAQRTAAEKEKKDDARPLARISRNAARSTPSPMADEADGRIAEGGDGRQQPRLGTPGKWRQQSRTATEEAWNINGNSTFRRHLLAFRRNGPRHQQRRHVERQELAVLPRVCSLASPTSARRRQTCRFPADALTSRDAAVFSSCEWIRRQRNRRRV